jgi:hypothetical protein
VTNAGSSGYTISEARSLANDVAPNHRTAGGSFRGEGVVMERRSRDRLQGDWVRGEASREEVAE